MRRRFLPLLLSAALLPAAVLAAPARPADPLVEGQLKALDYSYEIDEDGDFKLVFDLEDGRSQLVFVRSPVEEYGTLRVREIWSPGFAVEGDDFPAVVANRLLAESNDAKIGSWVKQGGTAMFVVKIDAAAPADQLADALSAAVHTADALEEELTLGKDEF